MAPHAPSNAGRSIQTRRRVLFGAAGTATAVLALKGMAFAGVASAQSSVSAATFMPFIGEDVVIGDGAGQATLRLLRVVKLPRGNRPESLRDPFSLIFSSALPEPLPAQVYEVTLAGNQTLTMFIMPVSANPNHYEAPFN